MYNTKLDTNLFTITLINKYNISYTFKLIYKPTKEEFTIIYNALTKNIAKINLINYYTNKKNTIISNITHRKYANCIIDIYNNNFLLINVFNFLSKI